MPSESAITRMQDVLFDVIDLGGTEERTSIVPNLTVVDAAPTGLTNFIIVQDDRDGDNILASTVPGVVYANNDKVNVLFIRGTEPIAFQQGSESTSANLWSIVPSTSTDIFYNSGNVGIGASTPATLLELEADDPVLRLDDTTTGGSTYSELGDAGQRMIFTKVSNTGVAQIQINPLPEDNVSAATFRFFRSTDTVGTVQLQFFRGNNTGTIDAAIGVNAANTYFSAGGGNTGIGIVPSGAKLHVDQTSTTAAIPVQILDQADVDEPFILFRGEAAAATLARSIVAEADVTTATRQGFVKIEIDDVGNQVTDQDYFVPFFTLA